MSPPAVTVGRLGARWVEGPWRAGGTGHVAGVRQVDTGVPAERGGEPRPTGGSAPLIGALPGLVLASGLP